MSRELTEGSFVAEYRILRVLGHGGFGITYLAYDENLDRNVAIKEYFPREFAYRDANQQVVPNSDEQDRSDFDWGMKHFVEEARNLTRFKHRNIVGAMRFVRQNGTAYLVMEFCDGESLEAMARRIGSVPEYVALSILGQLLDGLEEVHRSRLLHLDIKPSNIFIKKDGTLVLLDFGSARQAISSHTKSVKVASSGYAAIEQESVDIDSGKLGPWTDIYGLGATMYRLMTGERPPQATARILQDALKPIEAVQPGQYPSNLREVIELCLRLRPLERPRSIDEVRGLLNRGSARGELEHDKPPAESDAENTRGTARWVVAGAVAIASVIAALVLLDRQPSSERTVSSGASDSTAAVEIPAEPESSSVPAKRGNDVEAPRVSAVVPEVKKIEPGLPECPQSTSSFRDGCIGDFENAAVSYSGEWRDNRPEGRGELRYKQTGERYIGGVMNGMPHGKGQTVFRNGARYIGDFDQGAWRGRGIFVDADNGSRYAGDFVGSRIVIGIKYSGDCQQVLFAGSFNEDFTPNTAYQLDTQLYRCR